MMNSFQPRELGRAGGTATTSVPLPHQDPRPPYRLAADQVRGDIAAGRLQPGSKLPSMRQLAAAWGVAMATVSAALRELRTEGLIYTQHGRGSYITDAAPGLARQSPRTKDAPAAGLAAQVEQVRQQLTALTTAVDLLNQQVPRCDGRCGHAA